MNSIQKSCLVFLMMFSALLQTKAQVIEAAQVDKQKPVIITPHVWLLKSEANISLDSALTPASQKRFKKLDNKTVIFYGYEPYYYWFRFVLKKTGSVARDLMLLMGPIGMKDARIFQKTGGCWKEVGKTGYQYEFSQRSYPYAHYVFPISIQPATLDTFYISMDFSHDYRTYGFVLFHPKALKIEENKVYFSFGIIIGLLFLFFIINLYLYFSSHEKIHFWYSLYLVFLMLVVLKHDQLDEQFLGLDSSTAYRLTPIMSIAAGAIGLLAHVIQLFLKNIKHESLLYRISIFFKWNVFISAIAHFVIFFVKWNNAIESFVFHWADISAILAIGMILVNCVYSICKGYPAAWFILSGISLFLVGATERLLLISTPSFLFPPSLFHLGIIMETMIISYGLIYRFNSDKQEKIEYQREKEQMQVAFEKQILETKLEIQEQTMKNISQELHDNIGQLLIISKINLDKAQKHTSNWQIPETGALITKAIHDLRNLSKSLNTDYIMQQGFVQAIEFELELVKQAAPIQITLNVSEAPLYIDHRKELILFRICQEAFNNILKHANATHLSVEVNNDGHTMVVTIKDNGIGFVTNNSENGCKTSGLGLSNMHCRAFAIGAALKIKSHPGCGTAIVILLPNQSCSTYSSEICSICN